MEKTQGGAQAARGIEVDGIELGGEGLGGVALGSQCSLTILVGEQKGDLHHTPIFGPLVACSRRQAERTLRRENINSGTSRDTGQPNLLPPRVTHLRPQELEIYEQQDMGMRGWVGR